MAKMIEQVIAVKFSKIIKDSDSSEMVLNEDQITTLLDNIPQLAEGIIDDVSIVVEVMPLG